MKKLFLLALLALAPNTWAALLTYQQAGSINPGFFNFTIDGVANQKLLCDEFTPNVTSDPYNSVVVTLADILANNANAQLTALRRAGVSATTAYTFYRYVAYLDGLAYAALGTANEASTAAAVVQANRWMIDGLKDGKSANFLQDGTAGGTGPLPNASQTLLTQVQSLAPGFAVDPNFKIYTSPLNASSARLTQEQTGIIAGTPEVASVFYLGAGLVALGLLRKQRAT